MAKNSTAAERYEFQNKRIEESLKEIKANLKAHKAEAKKNGVNWAHVGDSCFIADSLQEILDSLIQE